MKQSTKIIIFVILGIVFLFGIYYLTVVLNEKIEENKYPSQPNLNTEPYQEIVDIFNSKDVYEIRDNSGWLEINGVDIDYEKKKASIESSPLAIESDNYEEALKQSGFTEEELLNLVEKINLLGFTKVGLITNQIAPERITLYGFCSNDECYKGVIYSLEEESIASIKKAILQTSDVEIIPTTNPHLFLFSSDDEYWL